MTLELQVVNQETLDMTGFFLRKDLKTAPRRGRSIIAEKPVLEGDLRE